MGPYLLQINEELKIPQKLQSLAVSSVSVGGLLGCISASLLADMCGRKKSVIVSFLFTLLGWLLVTFSINTVMFICGRVTHGLGEGMMVAISIIYLGELIPEKYRGAALASLTVAIQSGITLSYVFGVFLSWRMTSGIIGSINLVFLVLSFFLMESPEWILL